MSDYMMVIAPIDLTAHLVRLDTKTGKDIIYLSMAMLMNKQELLEIWEGALLGWLSISTTKKFQLFKI